MRPLSPPVRPLARTVADDKAWHEYELLCLVSRRTQAVRRELPPVEAPLVSGTVQSHLGEVARIREGRLHDAASSLKASQGGGFRGLDLPAFEVPKEEADTKKRQPTHHPVVSRHR